MNIEGPGLVCAATLQELQTFGLENTEVMDPEKLWRIPEGYAAAIGAGIPIALLRLLPLIQSLKPAWILNVGIAGAYPNDDAESDLKIGDVVVGISEVFADLGMEMPDEEGFRPLSAFPFADPILQSPLPLWIPEGMTRVKQARGATVNRCTGKDGTGWLRRKIFGVDFESMEGAAVALAANEANIPVCEIRAISNFAAKRDMRPENVQAALTSLKLFWENNRNHLGRNLS